MNDQEKGGADVKGIEIPAELRQELIAYASTRFAGNNYGEVFPEARLSQATANLDKLMDFFS